MSSMLRDQTGLTDEMIAEAQALVGRKLRIEQWNREATVDTIRHYCWGVGDDNPLYCDEDYAAAGVHGVVTAPPTFLFSIFSGAMGLGMRGIQPYGAGFKWEYYERIRRGDRILVSSVVGPVRVLSGRHARKFVIQTTLNEYVREADGAVIARNEARTLRVPRNSAAGGLSYAPRESQRYTAGELEAIRIHAISEQLQGASPRYWGTVKPGDELPFLVKGPIDLTTMISYYAGVVGSPRTKSSEMMWRFRTWAAESPERIPDNYDPRFYTEPVAFTAGHVDNGVAHEVGMPGAYNNGSQTTAWLAHTVTNWMGDQGFMMEMESKLVRPAIFGDTVWCHGKVTAKPAPGVVDLELSAKTQRDEEIATGRATVRLPVEGS